MSKFLTEAWPYAAALLVILGAIALIVLIVVLVRVARSMKHVNALTESAQEELVPTLKRVDPLVERAELTVDTLNLELLRVDAILEDVENVTDVAGKTADTVNVITAAPTTAVASLAERVQSAFGSKRKQKEKQERFVYPIGPGTQEPTKGAHSKTSVDTAKETEQKDEKLKTAADGAAEVAEETANEEDTQ